MATSKTPPTWAWLLALALLLGMAFQGSRGLWDPDEGRYTDVALQMISTGDYLVPHRNDDAIHAAKPPLTYWAIAGSVQAFGRNEWAVRLPNALAYALTVLMVLRLGRRFVPERPWLPALFYATSPLPFVAAGAVTTDTLLACAETAAVLAYVERRFGDGSLRWLDAMWALFGVAFMVKGPPGLLPLLAIVGWEWHARSRELWRPFGLLAALFVGGSWYGWLVWRHPELLDYLVGQEVVGRVASAGTDRHGEWYGAFVVYGPSLLLGMLPWALLALRERLRGGRVPPSNDYAFLWGWLLAPLALFVLARSRLPFYVLPLFVPIALLLARQCVRWQPTRAAWFAIGGWIVVLLAAKGWAARYPGEQDARLLAHEIASALPVPPREVIFVATKPHYGLRFYLDAEVEEVSITDLPTTASRPDDDTLAHELSEAEPGAVYVVPTSKLPDFQKAAQSRGIHARHLATVRKLQIFEL